MGERGPAPKPTALKVLQGNPGKRALPKGEPRPPAPSPPPAPRWLGEEARREWRRVARALHGAGLLTEADHDALALYCETFASWRRAARQEGSAGGGLGTWAGEEKRGQYKGPAHYNCRCLPVERVDPVRAGRTRWWTRK